MKLRFVEQTTKCVNPGNNAGKIQEFLGIKVDRTFGDETAEAVAIYLGYPNIKTRQDLFNHMVKDHPNEFKGGLGPNAQKVIGDLLYAECQIKAEKVANYKPSIDGPFWKQIMRLWNDDPKIKESLLTTINEEIGNELAKFAYSEAYCYSIKNPTLFGPNYFKPCIVLRANFNYITLKEISQANDDWMRVTGKFSGNADLVAIAAPKIYGSIGILFRIVAGTLEAKLETLRASASGSFKYWPFTFKFQSNKVKLYNYTWCGNLPCKKWATPLQSAAIKAVGTQKKDIMPWIKKFRIT